MKITIKGNAESSKEPIPAGDYFVALGSDGKMNLTGGGKTISIPAMRRRQDSRAKSTQVAFYSGGGKSWSLVVTVPKLGEWVAFIEMVD